MPTVTPQEEQAISDWLHEVASKHTWPDHDLHIDRINKQLKNQPDQWVAKSLDYLQVASRLVNKSNYRVVLAIGLEMTDYKRDTKNISLAVESDELWNAPPSLYLYDKDDEQYKRFEANMTHEARIDGVELKFYLYQWEDADEAGKFNAAFHVEIAS
jgi:hypothetical protein